MKKILLSKLLILSSLILILPLHVNAKLRNDYELTVKVSCEAVKGWSLYKRGVFVSKSKEGRYTDPDTNTKVYDFWSNGIYAKFDRDGNGHHETIFIIRQKELNYVGSLGTKGTFVHVSNNYKKLLHKSIKIFVNQVNR